MDRYYEEGTNNTTTEAVIWTSSNLNVATVNNGVITAVGVGTAIITATTLDGNKSDSCSVTVS
ncbi:Ig-like domain-containing protein [Clostridium magnum]|uniref:Bacterial Ig-like domain protein n=1 Tax=Clostridium magnum DSM 2767 TaxID=1121326 RepID=A0A161YSV6_9CLOT|nr:Ig-like domain-containing protein [Clostridium magnum]KZL94162.1 bacterial Ig-like domain protein [Clostridium magnum DSM 2767]SHH93912.1 Ig-like domain (group 2) [Clostridium magnum DSM 2767]